MNTRSAAGEPSIRQLLDAIPAFVFLTDDDLAILEYNAAAASLTRDSRRQILRHRGGEVLHCVHAHDAPGGCGRSRFCKHCLLRRTVNQAVAGTRAVRRRVRMQLETPGKKVRELYILVSATPVNGHSRGKRVLLILEDVAGLMRLRNLLPICVHCKRVQAPRGPWKDVGAYLRGHLDLLLANSYCPDCQSEQAELDELRQRVTRLTPREREVFGLVVLGRLNKQTAAALGTSEKTIKVHRGRVMRKLRVQSLAELVQIAERLGFTSK